MGTEGPRSGASPGSVSGPRASAGATPRPSRGTEGEEPVAETGSGSAGVSAASADGGFTTGASSTAAAAATAAGETVGDAPAGSCPTASVARPDPAKIPAGPGPPFSPFSPCAAVSGSPGSAVGAEAAGSVSWPRQARSSSPRNPAVSGRFPAPAPPRGARDVRSGMVPAGGVAITVSGSAGTMGLLARADARHRRSRLEARSVPGGRGGLPGGRPKGTRSSDRSPFREVGESPHRPCRRVAPRPAGSLSRRRAGSAGQFFPRGKTLPEGVYRLR